MEQTLKRERLRERITCDELKHLIRYTYSTQNAFCRNVPCSPIHLSLILSTCKNRHRFSFLMAQRVAELLDIPVGVLPLDTIYVPKYMTQDFEDEMEVQKSERSQTQW